MSLRKQWVPVWWVFKSFIYKFIVFTFLFLWILENNNIIKHGTNAFDNYYFSLFGQRWKETLLPSLLKKNRVIGFVNPFFKRFKIDPKLFHPRAEWLNGDLYGTIYVPS